MPYYVIHDATGKIRRSGWSSLASLGVKTKAGESLLIVDGPPGYADRSMKVDILTKEIVRKDGKKSTVNTLKAGPNE